MAEGARLESVYTARYPGFESLSLRHFPFLSVNLSEWNAPEGATCLATTTLGLSLNPS